MACFECRGLEVVDYHSADALRVEAKDSNTEFQEVDMAQGDWYDYDEQGGQSVGITGIEHRITVVR